MLYTLIKHGFLTNQSARRALSTLQLYIKLETNSLLKQNMVGWQGRLNYPSPVTSTSTPCLLVALASQCSLFLRKRKHFKSLHFTI